MKLFEMKKSLPAVAGLAKLHFGKRKDDRHYPPFREDEHIVLPDDPETELFVLMQGTQFLLRISNPRNRDDDQFWFGGTDEQPFLVRINYGSFYGYQTSGEDGFYSSLKPNILMRYERELKVETKRQGDMFALPMPHGWDELRKASIICLGGPQEPKQVKDEAMFGTRHRFKGLYAPQFQVFGGKYTLIEGTLEAPDHEPLRLEGVHMIVQADNLYSPKNAD